VRDLLLQRKVELTDLDLVLGDAAIPVARRVADRLGWAYYPLDEARDVARLVFMPSASTPLVCDIAGMRGGSIEADLRLRDFTVNAMALAFSTASATPTLIDTVGGQSDLQQGLLRRVSPMSIVDDPVRLLRAIRLATQLNFKLEAETERQLRRLAPTIQFVSPERVRDELWKLMLTPQPQHGIVMLDDIGLLASVLPEVAATIGVEQTFPHLYPVYEHTLNALTAAAGLRDWIMRDDVKAINQAHAFVQEKLANWRHRLRNHFSSVVASGHRRADWLLWFVLFHDVGKPQTSTLETTSEGIVRTRFF